MRRIAAFVPGVIGIIFLYLVLSTTQAALLINGAGATFPYPLYSKWFSEFHKIDPDVQFNFQSIGSGGGIRQFSEEVIDFGATDTPMTDQQIENLPSPAFHIPTVLGAVVLTYHLPGVSTGLKLSSEVVGDLFLGKILKWNDQKIQVLNPGISLPDQPIILVRRSDGSGTTAILTDYLSKISPEWKEKVGTGTAVHWPVGLGGKGNEGVAGLVKQTPGAIGYIELIFAETNHLPYAAIQNPAGKFVTASIESVTAAAEAALPILPGDFRISITAMPGPDAYPLSGFTYILVYSKMGQGTKRRDQETRVKGEKIVKFLHWAVTDGQAYAGKLFYAPLPPSLAQKVDEKIQRISVGTSS